MMENTYSPIMLARNPEMSIPTMRMLWQSVLNYSTFSFSKIVKIGFKMKLQSYFCLEFFQVPTKLYFRYPSPHLSEWNESKLPMFIKI